MKRIACSAVFAALVALMLSGCHGGGSAGTELAAMTKAMADAKSYKMTTVASGNEITMEIECPNKVRTITKAAGNTTEMVQVGTDTYMKAGGKWMKSPVAGAAPGVCASAGTTTNTTAAAGGASPNITKGDSTTINGVACQQWVVGAAAASITYCIGADNYPVQMKTSTATITYSDWNKTTVEAPKI